MEIRKIQKAFAIRLVIYLVIIAVITVIFLYLDSVEAKYKQQYDWLRNDISSLGGKIEGLNQKTLEFSDAVEVWKGVGEEQQKLQGLRINDAKDMLDSLKTKHKLSEVNISFSKPEDLQDENIKTESVSVVTSTVNISFKAVTDEHVFNFIMELAEKFPGYIQIKAFSLSRVDPITKDALEKLAKGETPGLVVGRVDFVWRDFKYKKPVSPENGQEVDGS